MESVKNIWTPNTVSYFFQPPYHRYHVELGEISSYPPGYKENAGIFCHNNPWISIAETVVGRGNRAWQVYTRTCPAYIEDISEIHRTEPYVYSQMIAGKKCSKLWRSQEQLADRYCSVDIPGRFPVYSRNSSGLRRIDRRSMYSIHSGWFRSKNVTSVV